MWCCLPVRLPTFDGVYMWCCLHVMWSPCDVLHVILFTCDVVYMWCCVHVMMCECDVCNFKVIHNLFSLLNTFAKLILDINLLYLQTMTVVLSHISSFKAPKLIFQINPRAANLGNASVWLSSDRIWSSDVILWCLFLQWYAGTYIIIIKSIIILQQLLEFGL